MCQRPWEMILRVSKMEMENLSAKPPKRRKPRRLKKRKHCTLFAVDQRNETERPSKQRKMKTAAPENTTQFIMADKQILEPFYVIPSPSVSPSSHCTSSPASVRGTPVSERDLTFDSVEEELVRDFQELDFDLDFFHRDFEETYKRIEEERLFALSKNELVCRYRELEGKEEILQKQCQEQWRSAVHEETSVISKDGISKCVSHPMSSQIEDLRAETATETSLRVQLEDLQRLNQSLLEENLRLKALKCSTVEVARLS